MFVCTTEQERANKCAWTDASTFCQRTANPNIENRMIDESMRVLFIRHLRAKQIKSGIERQIVEPDTFNRCKFYLRERSNCIFNDCESPPMKKNHRTDSRELPFGSVGIHKCEVKIYQWVVKYCSYRCLHEHRDLCSAVTECHHRW